MMKRSMILLALVLAVGCGESKPDVPVAAPPAMIGPVPRQVVITDEHGTRTVTAYGPGEVTPAPSPVAALTLDSVRNSLAEVINELEEAVERDSDHVLKQALYKGLARHLDAINKRLQDPDCNLAHEAELIGMVRKSLAENRDSPVKTLPANPPLPQPKIRD